MKDVTRQRDNPKHKALGAAPDGVDLREVAARAVYTGSPYHKNTPSFAGAVPRPRPDVHDYCPPELAWQREQVTQWLRDAILNGWFSKAWDLTCMMPRYVWMRRDNVIFEARFGTLATGYKGYPLKSGQQVKGLP